MQKFNQIKRKIPGKQTRLPIRKNNKNWWTPIWKGLATDTQGKHRRRMGISIWTYLYLLTFTNRATGIARRGAKTIAEEMGLPLRTIQHHLQRLASQGYITFLASGRHPTIRIEKWKSFNHSPRDET